MAKDRAKTMRRRIATAKLETTTGTEITTATGDYLECFDPDIKFDNTFTKRVGVGLGNRPGTPGAQSGVATMKTELRNASTAPLCLALLACAGFKDTSGVYTPQTSADTGDTCTFGLNTDGRFKSLAGVQWDLTMTGEIGKPVMMEWNGKGKRSTGGAGPRDVTPVATTPISGLPPVVKGITLTVGGTSYCISKFVIKFNNTVEMRPCATDPTGFYAAQITSRDITIELDPEAKSYTTKNFNTDFEAGTLSAISIVVGSGTNGTITIAAAGGQLQQPPEDQDGNGFVRDSLIYQCSENAGDDELTITRS